MDLELSNKKALVCAASRGIGLAIAEVLAEEGCELFICSRNAEEITQVAMQLSKRYDRPVHAMAVDLSQPAEAERLFHEAIGKMGAIDILVNNTGGPPPSSALDTEMTAWEKGFNQLFLSSTLLSQLCSKEMIKRQFGRILTITSISVVEPIDHLVVSTAMRSAVTAFCKTLSREIASFGVTVNTIMPGIIHTQRIENLRKAKAAREGTSFEEEMESTRTQIPAQRLGKPEEFASLVAYLSSPKAAYITGMNFCVDGGMRKSIG